MPTKLTNMKSINWRISWKKGLQWSRFFKICLEPSEALLKIKYILFVEMCIYVTYCLFAGIIRATFAGQTAKNVNSAAHTKLLWLANQKLCLCSIVNYMLPKCPNCWKQLMSKPFWIIKLTNATQI